MKNKKSRAHGVGPTRHLLKTFCELPPPPSAVIETLKNLVNLRPGNDLGSDNYKITKGVDLAKIFNASINYRQILLQRSNIEQPESEFDYDQWEPDTSVIQNWLSLYFKNVYRFRISVMDPDHSIPWHIDTNTSVCCRAQLCIDIEKNTFDFETKTGIESLVMESGKSYFINTGWKHRVINYSSPRIVAIFAFKFEEFYDNSILKK
jgi:hypothetical protein